MIKLTTGLIAVCLLTACSQYETATAVHKSDIDNCISELQSKINYINRDLFKGKNPDPNSEYHTLFFTEREELTSAIDETKTTRQTVAETGRIFKLYIDDGKFICPKKSIEKAFQKKFDDLSMEMTLRDVDVMNKQIDQALDNVIDEYKQKAVSHKIFNGPGPRVDQFVMKDGSVVYCKTTVTDGGKAVDCD